MGGIFDGFLSKTGPVKSKSQHDKGGTSFVEAFKQITVAMSLLRVWGDDERTAKVHFIRWLRGSAGHDYYSKPELLWYKRRDDAKEVMNWMKENGIEINRKVDNGIEIDRKVDNKFDK